LFLDTIFQIKRLIGRKFNDSTVQQDIKHFPFTVVEKNGKPIVQLTTRYGEKLFTPEEISAMILGKMRDIAVSSSRKRK
jgi:heat shock protein 5